MEHDRLHKTIIRALAAGRSAERDVIGALPPDVRDTPAAAGEWSPKDVQAHLSAWKARQANRLRAAQRGEEIESVGGRIDEINAEQYAARVDWPWDEVAAEAERVSDDLAAAVVETNTAVLTSDDRLLGGCFGNGPSHTFEHLGPLAARHGTEPHVLALGAALAEVARDGSLPDRDAGVLLYNLACRHALEGRLDEARSLLPDAFRLRPDLVEYAPTDDDLVALRGGLAELA
jgi:hypothetical protein